MKVLKLLLEPVAHKLSYHSWILVTGTHNYAHQYRCTKCDLTHRASANATRPEDGCPIPELMECPRCSEPGDLFIESVLQYDSSGKRHYIDTYLCPNCDFGFFTKQ